MFLPSVAVDPVTGNVAVGWYGTRGAGEVVQTRANFYIATSGDGTTFSNAQQVTSNSSNAFDPKLSELETAGGFGAAPGMAFFNGRLYPMWSDNTDLQGDNYFPPQFETATRVVGVIDVKEAPPAIRDRLAQRTRVVGA